MLKTASRRAGITAEMLAACVMTNVSTGARPGLAPCPRVGRRVRGLLDDCAGVITLTTAFAAFTLIGAVGLSVTAGDWYLTHRAMQSAADAGALGGAVQLVSDLANNQSVGLGVRSDDTSAVTTAAKNDTANNGFKDGQNGVTVTVSITNNQFVTVTISQPAQLMLAGLFMQTAPTIRATAQAGYVNTGTRLCVLATSPNASGAITISGSGTIKANGCAIVADSTSSSAASLSGSAVIDSAKICGPGGGFASGGAQYNPSFSKCPAVSDPYANYPAPSNANAPCDHTNYTTSTAATLSPGVYCGGITVNSASVSFQPGVYILRNGGITGTGSSTLTGTGVGFFLSGSSSVNIASDDVNFSGSTAVSFSAPTSGPLAGFIFFQDVTAASTGQIMNTLSGGSNVKYEGTLYFGNQNLTVSGSGVANGTSPFTALIANTPQYTGTGTLELNSDYANSNVPPPNMRLAQVSLTN
jgi:Flp pilus assembly protein TadG